MPLGCDDGREDGMSLGLDDGVPLGLLLGSDDGNVVIAQSPSFTVMVAVSAAGSVANKSIESTVTVLGENDDEKVPRRR